MNARRLLPPVLALLPASLPAQDLRHGIVRADAVLVGRQVGKTPHGEDVVLHRVQVVRDVRGAGGATAVTVIDWPKLSLHIRPTPRQTRLYCLQDASAAAGRLGLPATGAPYFKLMGWAGSNPLVGAEMEKDPVFAFAAALAASARGAPPADTAAELARLALHGDPAVRTEATKLLGERADLRGKLAIPHWSQLTSRAAGELEDVPYKIALAELCAAQRLPGLLDALAVSLGPVQDREYARAVGRIGAFLHGEETTAMLTARLRLLREPKDRAMVLLAIGASNTESACDALLQWKRAGGDEAVDAALREHRSQRAREAIAPKK